VYKCHGDIGVVEMKTGVKLSAEMGSMFTYVDDHKTRTEALSCFDLELKNRKSRKLGTDSYLLVDELLLVYLVGRYSVLTAATHCLHMHVGDTPHWLCTTCTLESHPCVGFYCPYFESFCSPES
jgi:hypothetical protein